MPIGQPTNFPTLDSIMELVRSIVRDTYPGVGGQQGRIFTNDAPFTLPFLNSAIRWMNRALRNEGVTFPIKDGVVIANLPPQVNFDPAIFVSLGFDGWNNGTTIYGNKRLPGDLLQPLVLQQRVSNTNCTFCRVDKAQEGLSTTWFPQQWFGQWEWRGYAIYMNGSCQMMDLMLRYIAGQSPFNTLPQDFSTTTIHVQDSEEAIAHKMAELYGRRNNGDTQIIANEASAAQEAVEEMALAYVRSQQTTNYRRQSYQGAGSSNGADDDDWYSNGGPGGWF